MDGVKSMKPSGSKDTPSRRGSLIWKYNPETGELMKVWKCSQCGGYFEEDRFKHTCRRQAPSFVLKGF